MVSIRRRRLQAMEQGQASHNHVENLNIETTLAAGAGSSVPSLPEEHINHPDPEVKPRKKHRRNNPDGMTGVYFKNMKYQAAIKVDKIQIHLGTFGSQEEAARMYDRAAFMWGRRSNFELSEEEKNELRKLSWEEFLSMTRSAINNRRTQRRMGPGS